MSTINAKDLLDPTELHNYIQRQLDEHGDSPEQLMVLLLKVATFKAILEDALELDEPIIAVLEKQE